MSHQFRLKWRMIRQILRSDDCILISTKDNEFDFKFAGKSLLFAQLYQRLMSFIPNWYRQWLYKDLSAK